ncbi:hypothetical protein VN97_g9539 [Penicillium thymicola]|uniref:Uncharacterized protein n=1 Tax=Penicillium thymicola TaxID=293382 RepID=A0AAI9X569_PENTH|nr:hypothetical protein VN97_g9539 [Penicillium thymicola]
MVMVFVLSFRLARATFHGSFIAYLAQGPGFKSEPPAVPTGISREAPTECCPVSSAGKLVSSLAIELNVSGGDAYYELWLRDGVHWQNSIQIQFRFSSDLVQIQFRFNSINFKNPYNIYCRDVRLAT